MPKHKENYYEVSKEQAKYMYSINTKKDDRFMVELQRMPSEAVNIENCVEACETISRTVVERGDFLRTETNRRTPTNSNRIYENLVYYQNGSHQVLPVIKSDLELENKTLILNKFFRSTECNYAAYENLCSGCGYGVFEARGRLCNFCQYVVHGAYERHQSSNREEDYHSKNGNIYENICDKCGTIYSSEECECGSVENKSQQELTSKNSLSIDENLDQTEVLQCKRVKKKPNKKSIFYGLIGSLRRVKNNLSPPQTPSQNSPDPRKRLEIVHNVDGYDKVFRTQESFDLDKICELKRTQNSCSDQHIYGRLKQRQLTATESFTLPTTLSQSHDQLGQDRWTPIEAPKQVASADCISSVQQISRSNLHLDKKSKRPRISKPRLLRSRSHKKAHKSAINSNAAIITVASAKQSLYLSDNVCQWMTSLRHEVHNYQSFGLVDDIAGCDPKSIPARNTLTYGQTFTTGFKNWRPALVVTNCQNIHKNIDSNETDKFCETPKISENNNDPCNWDGIVTLRRSANDLRHSPVARSRSQQLVQDFKRNLMSQKREADETARSPTSTSTPTPPTSSSTTMKTSPTSAQQRAKRQAIYLKLDDTPSNSSIEIANNNNQNNNNNIHTDAQVNYSSKQRVVEAASQLASDRGLASRCLALQPITAPSKRSGIYERDSEFVNDILCAFEQFLQREEADIKSDNVTLSEEVVAKRELSGDQSQTNDIEQSATCVKSVYPSKTEAESSVISVCGGGDRVLVTKTSAAIINDFQADPENALNKYQVALPDHHCNVVQPFVAVAQPVLEKNDRCAFKQIFNVTELISNLLLSRCLNSVVVYYDKPLSAFLRCLCDRVEYRKKYSGWKAERLVRKYQRFASYCQIASYAIAQQTQLTGVGISMKLKPVCESVEQDAELLIDAAAAAESEVKCCVETQQNLKSLNGAHVGTASSVECQNNSGVESIEKLNTDQKLTKVKCHNTINSDSVKDFNALQECQSRDSEVNKQTEVSARVCETEQPKKPSKPRVPQRDPATCITQRTTASPPRPIKRTSPIVKRRPNKMTVPTPNPNGTHPSAKGSHQNPNNSIAEEKEEDIYQPIWKFKTVGEVQERYHTDADYYEFDSGVGGASAKQPLNDSPMASQHPTILISNDVEDHGEWETDDEFMFTTQLEDCCPANNVDTQSLNSSTVRSTHSGSSITGSTVTGYASSSTTIASAVSASLMHHIFRNIGIFYSLSELKLRAIVYDYDRVFATSYFAKRQALTPASIGFEKTSNDEASAMQERSPIPPPRTSSASKTKTCNSPKTKRVFPGGESGASGRTPTKLLLLPDSVQAWKFMLLDVNYLEDEEDMIVSESEILRAQEHKDDIDTRQNQQLHFLQRFKSASIGNLIDIPTEEDKKSITERMRNKLQRGVFKLNVRSPKSEKKSRGLFRRAEATSLYLEDGMKPKYPIFGAPLDQLELNQTTQPNVPRFVVDCVEYIERKDCIAQDGLYRASGNKVCIDELKQKLSESYIYDPKLLVCDDIHTLTSLLKQFFRELGAPLIPQETYERLGRNLTDDAAIETMRVAFDEMREPNRSTLKFLIKHLTNVATYSSENRMPASNLAIVWGPCILSANQIEYDIARMNTLAKVLIENHDRIFSNNDNERLVC